MDPQLKTPVVVMLLLGFISMIVAAWRIYFHLNDYLISVGYRLIFIAKVLWAVLCASGIYLIIWPLPQRSAAVTISWFSILAIACICSGVGFLIYSRDVDIVMKSDSYTGTLPANPANGVHNSKERT